MIYNTIVSGKKDKLLNIMWNKSFFMYYPLLPSVENSTGENSLSASWRRRVGEGVKQKTVDRDKKALMTEYQYLNMQSLFVLHLSNTLLIITILIVAIFILDTSEKVFFVNPIRGCFVC